MVNAINSAGNLLVDPWLRLFRSPWPAMLAASFIFALLALVVFKFCSNQGQLRRARNRAVARLLELHLFRDDPRAVFGIAARIFAETARYAARSLPPLLALLVPGGLFIIQLSGWFQYRPLVPGEATLLTVSLAREAEVRAEVSPGLTLETSAFRSPRAREVAWRLRAGEGAGQAWIELTADGQVERKSVAASRELRKVSPLRASVGLWKRLANPAEPRLPEAGALREIRVDYPRRVWSVGLVRVNWVVALFVLSLGFGLVLRYPLRVEL